MSLSLYAIVSLLCELVVCLSMGNGERAGVGGPELVYVGPLSTLCISLAYSLRLGFCGWVGFRFPSAGGAGFRGYQGSLPYMNFGCGALLVSPSRFRGWVVELGGLRRAPGWVSLELPGGRVGSVYPLRVIAL